jgi:molecular chaperone HtpG
MPTTHAFQTEVQQLLHLMIHSLYTEREIFLRELIANASDACDRLRFESLTDPDLLKGDDQLGITLTADAEAHTLIIADNGIGMTETQAIDHLGTIAKSGTREFVSALSEAQTPAAAGLIGQFGVGFYSSFMVADRVVVESRGARVSSDEGVRWESTGDGNFTVETISRPRRGTTVTLHLKDDAREFTERWRLQGLVKKYSDYISYPIRMPKEPTDEEKSAGAAPVLEQINESRALWTRPKDEITDEQYQASTGPPAGNGTRRRRGCTSASRAGSASPPCSSSPTPGHQTCSTAAAAACRSMCGASSSWTIARTCCRNTCASSRGWSTPTTCRSMSAARCCSSSRW